MVRHGGFNYDELMNMSVYKRRYFITERQREAELEKKHMESARK